MLAILHSGSVLGIDAVPVTVEVDVAFGLPGYSMVGLPDSAIKESRERVFSAMKNSGFAVPNRRITINLAPADLRKEGTAFDLSMALGILAASEQMEFPAWDDTLILGELALDGGLRSVRGILSMTLLARKMGWSRILLPVANAREAALVPGANLLPVASLREAIEALRTGNGRPVELEDSSESAFDDSVDFSEIKGQFQAKRALEVSAAGGHNFVMVGGPGCGKTLMARRIPSILPPLTDEEGLETTRIYSVAGLLKPGKGLMRMRPFRSPHHSISEQALVGGGRMPRPGEVSLAHLGLLFLDELPEFRKGALETLRQPLEEGSITIARMAQSITYPSRCMFGAAMNPCPCGYFQDAPERCVCSRESVRRYRAKVSGPLLDRVDVHLEIPALSVDEMVSEQMTENSDAVRIRVTQARKIQTDRFRDIPGVYCNSHMSSRELRKFCRLSPEARLMLRRALDSLGLSARAFDRILKVGRTLADLDGSDPVQERHLAEAIHYRSLDRRFSIKNT